MAVEIVPKIPTFYPYRQSIGGTPLILDPISR